MQRKDVAIASANGDIYTSRLLSKFIFMPQKIDQQGEDGEDGEDGEVIMASMGNLRTKEWWNSC